VHVVDGHGERGVVRVGVRADHQRDLQLVEPVAGGGHADHAGGVTDEEGDLGGGDGLRGDDEVAFVLAVGVVDDHDHFAARGRRDGVRDAREAVGHGALLP
jgi:hypothetical protein